MTAKHCTATTAAGTPCKGWPLKDGHGLCLSHDVDARASVRFSGAQPGAGRKPVPKPTAIMRQLMLDSFMEMHGAHFRTMGYGVELDDQGIARLVRLPEGGAKLHGTSQRDGSINMSTHDDLGAQMKAANDLLDRHFGRPKQAVAVTGADGGAIMFRIGQLLNDETAQIAAELADRLSIEAEKEENP